MMTFNFIRILPHLACWGVSRNKEVIEQDLQRWSEIVLNVKPATMRKRLYAFLRLMTILPEYRSLFLYRLGLAGYFLAPLCRPMTNLYITTKDIGPGLFIQHGFSTIVAAKKIGKNCWINQQVTIGFTNATDRPVIGDNVVITAGAKIIGNVSVGDNVKVGANAVIVKDVPANCTVVVPAYIVRKNGEKTEEPL